MALDRDPEVMRYLTGGAATPRAEIEYTVRASVGHRWLAFDRETEDFVGWFALWPTGEDEYELGYRLRRKWWGSGLATEGGRAFVDAAFADLGASRVWAQTMAVNERSRRVMERCGLSFVRTFHPEWDGPIEGAELGEVEYELRRADWRLVPAQ